MDLVFNSLAHTEKQFYKSPVTNKPSYYLKFGYSSFIFRFPFHV